MEPCPNCAPSLDYPGRTIATDKQGRCSKCGREIILELTSVPKKRWDRYFRSICLAVASKSSCLSRQIGAILVKDNVVVATGFNGPARGIPHCGHERIMSDDALIERLDSDRAEGYIRSPADLRTTCPRKVLGYQSGEGLEWCTAEHAERNCIASAARVGASVKGTALYMNCVIPCKSCLNLLINAGIEEVVVDDATPYDKYSGLILRHTLIRIREFEL